MLMRGIFGGVAVSIAYYNFATIPLGIVTAFLQSTPIFVVLLSFFTRTIEKSGIESIVSPKQITAERISSYVRAVQNSFAQNKVESLRTLVGGRVEALEFVVRDKSAFVGVPLKDLQMKKNTLIAAIVRQGRVIIPGGGDSIQFGDSVIVITAGMIIDELGDIMR